jgi:hypothetical protein
MATPATPLTGRDFNTVFEGSLSPNGGLRNGGVSDRLRDRLVREEHAKLHRQGWEPVTVVNLQPFAITVNLGELGTIEVPAATTEHPVRKLAITHFRLSMRDLGDGNFTPVSVLPVELAKEIERECGESGGVFWYAGTGEPSEAQIAAARERQMAWFRRLYQQAIDSWSRYHQHKMLTDRQRDAARVLFGAGELAQLPEWVTITREQSSLKTCSDCGEDVKASARICRYCRFEFPAAGAPEAPAETPARGRRGHKAAEPEER